MITPVIPDVGNKTLEEIHIYIKDLDRRIKNTNIDEMLYEAAFKETLSDFLHFRFTVIRRIIAAKIGKNKLQRISQKERKIYKKIPIENRLTAKDILDGSILISNIGSIDKQKSGFLTLLDIVPPQIFVIGMNAAQEKPGVFLNSKNEKEIGIRNFLPLCLTFDHRALDFADILPFTKELENIFSHPEKIKLW